MLLLRGQSGQEGTGDAVPEDAGGAGYVCPVAGVCHARDTGVAGGMLFEGLTVNTQMEKVNTHMEKVNTLDSMSTTSQVLEKLRAKGMDKEFRWTPEGFSITGKDKTYEPGELEIIKTFRFEGASNPSDMEIIYILRANDGTIGYSQDAYGMYSSHDNEEGYDNFIRQVREVGHDEQISFEL